MKVPVPPAIDAYALKCAQLGIQNMDPTELCNWVEGNKEKFAESFRIVIESEDVDRDHLFTLGFVIGLMFQTGEKIVRAKYSNSINNNVQSSS